MLHIYGCSNQGFLVYLYLGAIHDCTSQNCPCSGSSCGCCPYSSSQCDAGGKYFMNPTSNASSDAFSPCSISTICSAMSDFTSCLEGKLHLLLLLFFLCLIVDFIMYSSWFKKYYFITAMW